MTIVRLISANGGGSRVYCFQLNRALEVAGFQTLTLIPPPDFDDELTKANLVPMDYRHITGFRDMLRELWPMRKEIRFIHSHLMRAALRGHLIAMLLRVPHVVTLHAPVYEGEPSPRDRKAIPFWRHVIRRARLVISISRFIQAHAYRQLGLRSEQVRGVVVYNGTDDPGIVARARRGSGPLRICVVGELTERKGMNDLLVISRALKERPLGQAIRIRVFGAGPYEEQLRVLQAEGCPIEVMGYCSDQQAIFAKSDLHMILSRTEAFGRVITEAMAFEVPTVCYRAGAFPELVMNGETGFLTESPEEIMAVLEYIAAHPEELSMMGMRCRDMFKARFDVAAFAGNTLEALKHEGLIAT